MTGERAAMRRTGWGDRPWTQDELDAATEMWCRHPVHQGAELTPAMLRAAYAPPEPAAVESGPAPPPPAEVVPGSAWDQEREGGTVYTSRQCSRCGRFYVWPKGSRRPNGECPVCQPELPL